MRRRQQQHTQFAKISSAKKKEKKKRTSPVNTVDPIILWKIKWKFLICCTLYAEKYEVWERFCSLTKKLVLLIESQGL